jgi:hypothetical protein
MMVPTRDRNDDLPPAMPLFEITDGLRNLAQGIGPIDDRDHLAGFQELPDRFQVGLVRLHIHPGQLAVSAQGSDGTP